MKKKNQGKEALDNKEKKSTTQENSFRLSAFILFRCNWIPNFKNNFIKMQGMVKDTSKES